MLSVTVTVADLEVQPAFALVHTCRGLTEHGDRVRFTGDWRTMGDLYEGVRLLGEMTVRIGHWQVAGRLAENDPPEYET